MIPQTDFSSTFVRENGVIRYTNAYGSYEFTELPLQQVEEGAVNTDKLDFTAAQKLQESASSMKLKYTIACLGMDSRTRDICKDISGRTDEAIEQFMDGTMTGDELASQFQTLAHELFESTARVGYPIPMIGPGLEQECTEAFYDECRRKIVDIALRRNNEEGKQYLTGEMTPGRSCKYYNADYYYKSEAAIAAITKGMDEFVQDRGWDYTPTDYKGEGLYYYNFNTAFSKEVLGEKYILDPDAVPPRDFVWFYETGRPTNVAVLESISRRNPDGSETILYQRQRSGFDPLDPTTGRAFISYTGEDGTRHIINKDILFSGDDSDLMNLGELFSFAFEDENDPVRTFLNNLQLYPKGFIRTGDRVLRLNCCV